MSTTKKLELSLDQKLATVIYKALYFYQNTGGELAKEEIQNTDALEIFRIANMCFQEEPEEE